MNRPKLPAKVEAQILLESRRRCCICFGLRRDSDIKRGQIAHLDRDRNNNKPGNLAFLCFDHHDEYDSQRSQSKGFTLSEVKVMRAELQEALAAALRAPLVLKTAQEDDFSWPGVYRWEHSNSSAEVEIVASATGELHVSGFALWGTRNEFGPNTGELDSSGKPSGDKLTIRQGMHTLQLRRIVGGLEATEITSSVGEFGLNVSFSGTYGRVPRGAQALPQPQPRPFESEFWPAEGIPVFSARVAQILVHSRPSSDSPVISKFKTTIGKEVGFAGFRYRTVRPGTVLALKDTTIAGRNLGQTDYVSHASYDGGSGEEVSFVVRSGTEMEYLQYRAEGSGFVRWQGLVILVESLPWLVWDSDQMRQITSPVAESWVMVESDAGPGWVLADEFLHEVRREF